MTHWLTFGSYLEQREVDGEGCGKMNTSGSDTRTGTESLKDNRVVKGYMYGGFQLE